jgi:hypothetical protein
MQISSRMLFRRRVYTVQIGTVRISWRRATFKWARFALCRDSREWWPFWGSLFLPFVVIVVSQSTAAPAAREETSGDDE